MIWNSYVIYVLWSVGCWKKQLGYWLQQLWTPQGSPHKISRPYDLQKSSGRHFTISFLLIWTICQPLWYLKFRAFLLRNTENFLLAYKSEKELLFLFLFLSFFCDVIWRSYSATRWDTCSQHFQKLPLSGHISMTYHYFFMTCRRLKHRSEL